MDNSSLAHSKWNCKYDIVSQQKYRRQIIYGKIKADIGQILRKLCENKGLEIIEANAYKDYIHMLVSIPLWCKGYYVHTVGRNKKVIEEYIKNQIQEDLTNEQISMK